jgi:hypothetical protein
LIPKNLVKILNDSQISFSHQLTSDQEVLRQYAEAMILFRLIKIGDYEPIHMSRLRELMTNKYEGVFARSLNLMCAEFEALYGDKQKAQSILATNFLAYTTSDREAIRERVVMVIACSETREEALSKSLGSLIEIINTAKVSHNGSSLSLQGKIEYATSLLMHFDHPAIIRDLLVGLSEFYQNDGQENFEHI